MPYLWNMKRMTSLEIKELFRSYGVVLHDGEARLIRYAATTFQLNNLKKGDLPKREVAKHNNYIERITNMAAQHVNFPSWVSTPCLIMNFPDKEIAIL